MRRRAGKLVVQYMRAHRDLCAQFVPGDFTEYCDRMGTDGVHIEGDVEIRAAAEVLNVNIYTFAQSDHHDRHITKWPGKNSSKFWRKGRHVEERKG